VLLVELLTGAHIDPGNACQLGFFGASRQNEVIVGRFGREQACRQKQADRKHCA
jgi:hypothetical protein